MQLDALHAMDDPWSGHGTQVAYEFCRDAGSLELSRYFYPTSTSLYHQDHFEGKFRSKMAELMSPHEAARIVGEAREESDADGNTIVCVRVEGGGRAFEFRMARCEVGRRKGAWMTASVTPVE